MGRAALAAMPLRACNAIDVPRVAAICTGFQRLFSAGIRSVAETVASSRRGGETFRARART
jgi:hypothetical protein